MANKNNEINQDLIQDEESMESNENENGEKQAMSMEELREQYEQLPMWKHVLLVILALFAMAAVFMLIDFTVDFLTELIKRIV